MGLTYIASLIIRSMCRASGKRILGPPSSISFSLLTLWDATADVCIYPGQMHSLYSLKTVSMNFPIWTTNKWLPQVLCYVGPDHECMDHVAKAAPCLRLRPYSSSSSNFMADLHRKSDFFSGRVVLGQSPHILDETPTLLSFPRVLPPAVSATVPPYPCGTEGRSGQRRFLVLWETAFNSVSLNLITFCFTMVGDAG
jgi:hypothetical protein